MGRVRISGNHMVSRICIRPNYRIPCVYGYYFWIKIFSINGNINRCRLDPNENKK
jgi:hypothetical protein